MILLNLKMQILKVGELLTVACKQKIHTGIVSVFYKTETVQKLELLINLWSSQ